LGGAGGSSSTGALTWLNLVTPLSITGCFSLSLSSNAALAILHASAGLLGSSTGT
jgi:hypothetical protein